jgi:hypothetical protein
MPHLTDSTTDSIMFSCGLRFPNTVGSPMESEIISFSGFGFRSIVSSMLRIGLKVFLAMAAEQTFHFFCWCLILGLFP